MFLSTALRFVLRRGIPYWALIGWLVFLPAFGVLQLWVLAVGFGLGLGRAGPAH